MLALPRPGLRLGAKPSVPGSTASPPLLAALPMIAMISSASSGASWMMFTASSPTPRKRSCLASFARCSSVWCCSCCRRRLTFCASTIASSSSLSCCLLVLARDRCDGRGGGRGAANFPGAGRASTSAAGNSSAPRIAKRLAEAAVSRSGPGPCRRAVTVAFAATAGASSQAISRHPNDTALAGTPRSLLGHAAATWPGWPHNQQGRSPVDSAALGQLRASCPG